MNFDQLEQKLGFTDVDRENWLQVNALYYTEPMQGWHDKLKMHACPQRSAAVYVMPSYQSPITNKWVDSPSQRRDDLARNGCRPWEGMETEKKEGQRRAEIADQEMDKLAEKMTLDAWEKLPEVHRNVLLDK